MATDRSTPSCDIVLRQPAEPSPAHHRRLLATDRRHPSLPSLRFQALLTLFSGSFSSFPRGTCSLSVSHTYLALGETYHPLWAAFPSNPTLRLNKIRTAPHSLPPFDREKGVKRTSDGLTLCRPMHGTVTLSGTPFQGISVCSPSTSRCPAW